jgi:hypothetical protein
MQTYIYRQDHVPSPLLGAVTFDARSPSHAQLRAALLGYVILGYKEVPDVTRVLVDDGATPDAAYFPDSFILPIEESLCALFASCRVPTI